MPFQMKIQPINSHSITDLSSKPPNKSRLKRLFDRPFTNVLRGGEFEASSVALDKMVQSFMEENEKTMTSAGKYGRNNNHMCNCFNRTSNEISDDDDDHQLDFDFGISDSKSSFSDSSDTLKSLIPCPSKIERNLLADASKIVDKNRACKRKDDLVKIVTQSLIALNYDAALCKSKWDKSSSIPAGEYEYIDVIIDQERVLIDVDFRSEFEIARSTGTYKGILQSLPVVFVGKAERLSQIIAIAAEAARISLKKKGMHVAPWRKPEYIRSKWLANFKRISPLNDIVNEGNNLNYVSKEESGSDHGGEYEGGELDLIFGEETETTSFEVDNVSNFDNSNSVAPSGEVSGEGGKLDFSVKVPWQPPPVKLNYNKAIVTGLASLLKEKF
ncbi:hypothetical protein LIER_22280 [Lithospermum erythrorhizon]|uniref:Uncharacterized protein n=1 Tax=Lithospermum erythrorhizon TaxID=34254 RepID=A0AAV3QWB2_LITER